MLYPYHGSLDISTWRLVVPRAGSRADYLFAPTATRPGGLVRFTSRRAVWRFLGYHRERWGPLTGARMRHGEPSLEAFLRDARARCLDRPDEAPELFPLLYLDPRPPFGGGGELDADVVGLVPAHLRPPLELPAYNG